MKKKARIIYCHAKKVEGIWGFHSFVGVFMNNLFSPVLKKNLRMTKAKFSRVYLTPNFGICVSFMLHALHISL